MTRELVWYGQLTTPGKLRRRGLAFLGGGVAWLGLFLMLPSLLLAAMSVLKGTSDGGFTWSFTLENFRRLAGYSLSGWSADNLLILGRSLCVAGVTTAICLVAAYPVAFFIASRPARTRYLWLALVVIPLCTNLVIRTYAWQLILGQQMPLGRLLAWLGLVGETASLCPGPLAVYLGMVASELPFAVLPIYTNVERLDWSIVEAARDLYGSRRRVFLHGILPQTLPGLLVAFILTFIPAIGAFVVPAILGGGKYMLVGNLIQLQFGEGRDWPFGAAVSLALILLTLGGLLALRRWGEKAEAA